MKHDRGAALLALGRRHGEASAAVRGPHEGLVLAGPPGNHIDAAGDDEGRIEADAELADEVHVPLRLLDAFHEGLGAGLGDGAQILDQFVVTHADAVVGDGQRLGRLVGRDGDPEVGIALQQFGGRNGFVAQLVERIGGVGDELAQEDIAVGIDRMHHEMQELGDLCLELVRLGPVGSGCFLCCLGHDVLANPGEIGMPYGLAGAQVKGTKKRPDPGPGRKLRTPH